MANVKAHEGIQVPSIDVSYSRPSCLGDIEPAVKDCKARVASGKKCYCVDVCHCRQCQETNDPKCKLKDLLIQGGCVFGCNQCSNCKPCW